MIFLLANQIFLASGPDATLFRALVGLAELYCCQSFVLTRGGSRTSGSVEMYRRLAQWSLCASLLSAGLTTMTAIQATRFFALFGALGYALLGLSVLTSIVTFPPLGFTSGLVPAAFLLDGAVSCAAALSTSNALQSGNDAEDFAALAVLSKTTLCVLLTGFQIKALAASPPPTATSVVPLATAATTATTTTAARFDRAMSAFLLNALREAPLTSFRHNGRQWPLGPADRSDFASSAAGGNSNSSISSRWSSASGIAPLV